MNCYIHTESESVGACTSCGRSICHECAVELQDKLVCRECLNSRGAVPQIQDKDPNTAFLIELVGGIFFGLLGLGHIYVGRTNDGILRLIIWLLYEIMAVIIISLLLAVVIGIICIPIQLVIQIGIPVWSAITLKNTLLQDELL